MARYELNAHWYTPNELSEMSGIPAHTIRDRLRRGFTVEESVKDIPLHESVKGFTEASTYTDWIGMPISDLYKIYWKWTVLNGYQPLQIQGFSRQLTTIYPMLKTVPTKRGDKCGRIIRMKG